MSWICYFPTIFMYIFKIIILTKKTTLLASFAFKKWFKLMIHFNLNFYDFRIYFSNPFLKDIGRFKSLLLIFYLDFSPSLSSRFPRSYSFRTNKDIFFNNLSHVENLIFSVNDKTSDSSYHRRFLRRLLLCIERQHLNKILILT